jgi:NADP-dependent 3-hydroxy acid dehydrogenase YdfG
VRVSASEKQAIDGKVVVITGASSGIGQATARRLAAGGAKVVLGARRSDRLDALVADIRSAGGDASAMSTDVADRADVQTLVDAAVAAHGRVDVLFANAGIMPISRLDKLEVANWEAMIDVNLKGVLWAIAAVLPIMRAQGSGHVLVTGSVGDRVVVPAGAVYSATKFAVRALCEGLRLEEPSLRVTLLSPGTVATELGHDITDADMRAAGSAAQARAVEASSLAEAVAFAVSQPEHVDVSEMLVRATGGF